MEGLNRLESIANEGWPFTTWRLGDFEEYEPPTDSGILENGYGDVLIDEGTDVGIVGPPGIGKSRLALQLAVAQITGQRWAGLPTRWPAKRWLYVGNENSVRRQKADICAMARNLSEDARTQLGANLHLHVQSERDDHNISVGDAQAMDKWRLTIEQLRPDCIIIDPFEALLENADANDSGDVRRSMNTLSSILRDVVPTGIVIYVHHARTGAMAAAGALGLDGNNYAKGSKTFTGIIRAQINVCPASVDEPGRIAVTCGKSNDCRPFTTTGLVLGDQSRTYDIDPDFDAEDLAAILQGKDPPVKVSYPELDEVIRSGKTRFNDIAQEIRNRSGAKAEAVRRKLSAGVREGRYNTALGIYTVSN